MDDNGLIDYQQIACLKQQSEYIIGKMDELLKRNNLNVQQIDNYVITEGPGSYTGVRIAMTVAKVLGSIAEKNIYTLSTLQLYAGMNDCYVFMDARAKRVYAGRYRNGVALIEDTVYPNQQAEEIMNNEDVMFIGDLHLFGKEDYWPTPAENFFSLKPMWKKVENIDILAPTYLKSKEEYLK